MPAGRAGDVLTPKQEAFALAYVETGNAAEAYRRAYDVRAATQHSSIYVNASKLLAKPKVAARVSDLQAKAAQHVLNEFGDQISQRLEAAAAKVGEDNAEDLVSKFLLWLSTSGGNGRVTHSNSLRYRVFEEAGFKCQACGVRPQKDNDVSLHVDHIVPKSLGGGDGIENLQSLCADCNRSKGNRHSYNHKIGWCDGR